MDLAKLPYTSTMTVEDCFELGKIAYSETDYYHTELWMAQALRQLDEGEETEVDAATVLDYLSYSVYQQGALEKALDYTRRLLQLGEWIHTPSGPDLAECWSGCLLLPGCVVFYYLPVCVHTHTET